VTRALAHAAFTPYPAASRLVLVGGVSPQVTEVSDGLRQYFDLALPGVLLYAQERPQAQELLKAEQPASEVYGPEHLLRLFGAAAPAAGLGWLAWLSETRRAYPIDEGGCGKTERWNATRGGVI
jgi:hypothetical protein